MRSVLLLLSVALTTLAVHAQKEQGPTGLRYVLPQGSGTIIVPVEGWQPQELSLLDDGTRLVAQFGRQGTDLVASYVLFPSTGGTSDTCRASVMDAVLSDLKGNGTVADEQQSARTTTDGKTIAVAAYRITKAGDRLLDQENIFGFYGTAQTCFEIHVSKPHYRAADMPALDAVVNAFTVDPSYQVKPADYGLIATLFFNYIQDTKAAAVYYQRALDTLPKSAITAPTATVLGRVTVVQLATSYGMSGDLARSRAVSEAAVARDPDYPLYYYNLANADAEAGNAAAAKGDLLKAFDRRKNLPPGLPMPDPENDGSFQNLKQDPQFAAFLRSLPKN